MTKLAIIDLETTAIRPDEGSIIEIAVILYSVKHSSELAAVSTLIPTELNQAKSINHIDELATQEAVDILDAGLSFAKDLINSADYVVAHNAAFEKAWLPWIKKPWLCTFEDFIWPKNTNKQKTSLIETAVNHGVPVISAHRALDDCRLISSLLSSLSLEERIRIVDDAISRSNEQKVIVIAHVSYDDRELAKTNGFTWNNKSAPKAWSKLLRPSEIENWNFHWTIKNDF